MIVAFAIWSSPTPEQSSPETILVYDLGGGTFDASLVTLDENVHHVVASEGIPTIGGDDFDQILAEKESSAILIASSPIRSRARATKIRSR